MVFIPKWLLQQEKITRRQWKEKKRKELNDIIKAYKIYQTGCRYCPEYERIELLEHLLSCLKKSHSQKKWGR